jgi:hypothetical protein
VFSNGFNGELFWCRRLAMPVFSGPDLGSFLRREAEVMMEVLSSWPDVERRPAKGKCSAEGRLERASESPNRRSNSRSCRAAMAIGLNPLSSTRKSAQIDVIS